MPEPVLYVRGFPGTGAFEAADPGMVSDLLRVASLTETQVADLQNRLQEWRGFLDPQALRRQIGEIIADKKTTEAVFRALVNLDSDDVEDVLQRVERTRKKEKKIDDAQMVNLRRNLAGIVRPYPSLVRFEKAQRLATLTGQRLDSIDLVCDVRPIFDKEGRDIEGMFPYTRLRVVATGVDGLPRDFEVELTVAEVFRLYETAMRAKTKLETLRAKIETWTPQSIPNLPQVRVPKGETNA